MLSYNNIKFKHDIYLTIYMRLISNRKFLAFFVTVSQKTTPNPNFLKFMPNSKLVNPHYNPIDITTQKLAKQISPLAHQLITIKGVTRVFLGYNFISIAKQQTIEWNQITHSIQSTIQQYFSKELPVFNSPENSTQGSKKQDDEAVKMIKEILDMKVRPKVQDDGGDIVFSQFNAQTGILRIKMLGSCTGCPSSSNTLKNGIEKLMKYYVGEVKKVQAQDFK